ncbi:MAG: sugar ABC transporter substrate-binding protein [Lachnospiraceae bacterium]|nr:sugar ABC transporter substrate-binding protein [Lachnospiraceae bacterium]
MNKRKRWFTSLLLLLVLGFMILNSLITQDMQYRLVRDEDGKEGNSIINTVADAASSVGSSKESAIPEDSIVLWYTDENLKEYLESEALSFQGEHGVKIEPVLVSGVKLLEQINTASIERPEINIGGEKNGEKAEEKTDDKTVRAPDIYVTSHDNLLKAYYSGLAVPINDADVVVVPQNYPQTAIDAVTCNNKVVAYPFYYETNFLLYNKTYMANIAKQKVNDESLNSEGETEGEGEDPGVEKEDAETIELSEEEVSEAVEALEAQDSDPMGNEDGTSDPAVLEKLATMIPTTITDITNFANNYDAPDTVEAVFKWDITDVFYNYFFVGNYMSVGGEHGDDNTILNVYNQQAVDCLSVYRDMNKYFSIDTEEVTYDEILNDFIEGKLVFTVATTDAIARIEEAKANGEFEYEYGVAVLPDVTPNLKSRGMSVTNSVAINGYSDKADMAMNFGHYIAYTKADNLYKKSGKLPCRNYVSYENKDIMSIVAEYQKSVPLPKLVETSDYWVQLEIAFTKVWNGADPEEALKGLAEAIGSHIDELDYHTPIQESIGVGL